MRRSFSLLLLLAAATPAVARVKLSALPQRERVGIRLDHGRATLVEEERIVPLLPSTPERGNNRVDFSWANTRIDKNSIQFRPLAIREEGRFRPVQDGEISVVNVSYPPNENALVWEVYAKRACALKVRVSYLISNLTRKFAYRALANGDETHLTLRKYLRLSNWSGEDFGDAGVWAGFGPSFLREVAQQRELKLLLQRFERVPVRKTFTFDWYAHGPLDPDKPKASKVLLHYEIENKREKGLGAYPLQPGKVRIFIEDGSGGAAFLGEDWAKLTPIDDELRLYLGEARDVVCTRTIRRNKRHPVHGNLFHQELLIRYEIENFKKEAVTLDIVERVNRLAQQFGRRPKGDAEWTAGEETTPALEITTERGRAVPVLHATVPAAGDKPEKHVFEFHVTIKNLW